MKIIINNQTKDLTDSTCLVKVYQFLGNKDFKEDFEIFTDCMPITFGDYVCYVRHLKNGFSFKFKNIIRGEQ